MLCGVSLRHMVRIGCGVLLAWMCCFVVVLQAGTAPQSACDDLAGTWVGVSQDDTEIWGPRRLTFSLDRSGDRVIGAMLPGSDLGGYVFVGHCHQGYVKLYVLKPVPAEGEPPFCGDELSVGHLQHDAIIFSGKLPATYFSWQSWMTGGRGEARFDKQSSKVVIPSGVRSALEKGRDVYPSCH